MTLDQSFEALKTLAESEIAKSHAAGRQAVADSLSLTMRRIRQAQNDSDIANLLVHADPSYTSKVACLVFEGDHARILLSRGILTSSVTFPIHHAPALLSVIETRDMVVAQASASELSEPLAHALASESVETGKAHLIPVVVDDAVRMVLILVERAAEAVEPASLSILCEAAALRLELIALQETSARRAHSPEPEQLVQIGNAQTNALRWADLNAAEQSLHLHAQRFAQVAVARMRVEQQAAVRDGQNRRDLYSALRSEIDQAREQYRVQFLTGQSKTMVDYLYLEIVRSLANEQDQLLGPGFPGRLI